MAEPKDPFEGKGCKKGHHWYVLKGREWRCQFCDEPE